DFAGLNAVKRQQKIYAILGGHIASGAIHAVSMNLKSPDET
ncbi:MAG: BolA/IbaG family iron-sulfur metabolism protein, partial [Gammaproteobacteria bacterium]|nr:BolA/IbaG family iron-sulfur metabolism protein [Gammaproteobacteria bacterium]